MSEPLLSPRPSLAPGTPRGTTAAAIILLLLGAWLVASPLVFAYDDSALGTSNRLSGVAILALALGSLLLRSKVFSTVAGCIGLWVMVAPVVLRAPSTSALVSASVTGILVVAEGLADPLRRVLSARRRRAAG